MLFAAVHESVSGPNRRLLQDGDKSEIGDEPT